MKLIRRVILTLALFTLFASAQSQRGWLGAAFNDDGSVAIPIVTRPPTPTLTPAPTPQPVANCTWFVAVDGGASGDGSITKPWALGYVARGSVGRFINQVPPAVIKPGDDICLMAGRYPGLYRTAVNGTAAAPIKYHPYPGERVIIDDQTVWPDLRSIGNASVANDSNVVNASAGQFTSADVSTIDRPVRIMFGAFDALITKVNNSTQVVTSQTNSSGSRISDQAIAGPIPPDGRANTFTVSSQYTYVYGLEVTNSNPNRTDARLGGIGLDQDALGSKAFNNIIYDAGGGFSKNDLAPNTEISWNLVLWCGWDDRNTGLHQGGTGHGIYAANRNGFFKAYDNIMVNGFGFGFHVYSAGTGRLNGVDLQWNVSVDNGYWTRTQDSSYAPEGRTTANFLVGHRPISSFTFKSNFGFHREGRGGMNADLGYSSSVDNPGPAIITDNTLIGGTNSVAQFASLTFSRNTLASNWAELYYTPPNTVVQQLVDGNVYYWYNVGCPSTGRFNAPGEAPVTGAQWRAMGFDANSAINPCGKRPAGVKVTIRANAYDPTRWNVIVNNFDKLATVNLDLGAALKQGDKFELRNVQDYFGPLLAGGSYNGPVNVNMIGLTVARPVGWTGALIPSSGPDFGVFVLIKKALK